MDLELAEDPRQVELDGLRAEEELRADVAVRESLRDEEGDLQLLRRQALRSRRIASTQTLAARAQLGSGPLRPRARAHLLERARLVLVQLECRLERFLERGVRGQEG